jgi:hypothetical protein
MSREKGEAKKRIGAPLFLSNGAVGNRPKMLRSCAAQSHGAALMKTFRESRSIFADPSNREDLKLCATSGTGKARGFCGEILFLHTSAVFKVFKEERKS